MATEAPADIPAHQTSIPTIHSLEHSQALRVIWALQEVHAHNGLKFDVKNYPRVRPINPDLRKLSPMGKSPIMTVTDLEGKPLPNIQVVDGVLMETRLILEFISETYGGGDMWTPESDEDKRRDVYFREFACNSYLERVDQAMIFEVIPQVLGFPMKYLLGALFSPIGKIFKTYLVEHHDHMEVFLTEDKPYLAGKKLGIADFCMEFPLSIAIQRGFVDAKKYPKIVAYYERLRSREAYKKAIEMGGGPKKYDLMWFGQK